MNIKVKLRVKIRWTLKWTSRQLNCKWYNPSTLPFMGGFFNVNMADFVLIMWKSFLWFTHGCDLAVTYVRTLCTSLDLSWHNETLNVYSSTGVQLFAPIIVDIELFLFSQINISILELKVLRFMGNPWISALFGLRICRN